MVEEIIYSMEAPYREKLQVRGYHFGKKEEKTAKQKESEKSVWGVEWGSKTPTHTNTH